MTSPDALSFHASSLNQPNELKPKEIVEKLLLVLSEKEKFIIQHRFELGTSSKKTLEEIGQHYGVTRERVRQIEKNALKKLKRNAFNTPLKFLNEISKGIIKKHGGLLIDSKLIHLVLNTIPTISPEETNEIRLSLTLDPEVERASNTIDLHPHWRLNSIPMNTVRRIGEVGHKRLAQKGDVMALSELVESIRSEIREDSPDHLITSTLEIDKRTKFVKEGVGLKAWRHINPRTLRDKIHFILEKEKKPLHFEDIAQKIRDTRFDNKKINIQAVHNELIRNDHFILIGRGIYALSKWGYNPGTVADVLAGILKDGKARSREEIMKEVLKQRQVKKITIYLNLKNNPKIKTLAGDKYQWTRWGKIETKMVRAPGLEPGTFSV